MRKLNLLLASWLGFWLSVAVLVSILVAFNNYFFYSSQERSAERNALQLEQILDNELKFCRKNRISGKRYRLHMVELVEAFADKANYNDTLVLKHLDRGTLWEKQNNNWDKVAKSDIEVTIPRLKSDDSLYFHVNTDLNTYLYLISIVKSMTFSIWDIGEEFFQKGEVSSLTCDIAWYRSRPAIAFAAFAFLLVLVSRKREIELDRLRKEKDRPGVYENPDIAEIFNFLDSGQFEKLEQSNLNVNAINSNRETALMLYAHESMDEKVKKLGVKALVDSGADVNLKNREGMTALMFYVQKKLSSIVQLLLENGAKEYVDEKNKNGLNSLVLATMNSDLKTVKILTKFGADIKGKIETNCVDLTDNEEIKDHFDTLVNNKADKTTRLLDKIFSKEKPIKFTTHSWDEWKGNVKKSPHNNFDNFMLEVKGKWDEIEQELYELSTNLHKKIRNFLFADKNNIENWCSKNGDELAVGWSSLDGLDKWCNDGNDPFKFKLSKTYSVNGSDIGLFGDVIKLFKQEVQARRENNMLENIFIDKEEELDYKYKFILKKLKGKQFYADMGSFVKVLDMIFNQFKDSGEFQNITVEIVEDSEGLYYDLRITQHDSFSYKSALQLLERRSSGDFAMIQDGLENLCDWSVESCYENECFKVNFLKSTNMKDIETLENKAQGFTHILRFYQ